MKPAFRRCGPVEIVPGCTAELVEVREGLGDLACVAVEAGSKPFERVLILVSSGLRKEDRKKVIGIISRSLREEFMAMKGKKGGEKS